MMRARPSRTPFVCPVCGERLLATMKSCPQCGACERSGWSGDTGYDGLDLPGGGDFDYDEFVANEFGKGPRKKGMTLLWWIVAILSLLAFAAMSLVR